MHVGRVPLVREWGRYVGVYGCRYMYLCVCMYVMYVCTFVWVVVIIPLDHPRGPRRAVAVT